MMPILELGNKLTGTYVSFDPLGVRGHGSENGLVHGDVSVSLLFRRGVPRYSHLKENNLWPVQRGRMVSSPGNPVKIKTDGLTTKLGGRLSRTTIREASGTFARCKQMHRRRIPQKGI